MRSRTYFAIEGNEMADKCALNVPFLDETMSFNHVLTPLILVANKNNDSVFKKITRFSIVHICRKPIMLWSYRLQKGT